MSKRSSPASSADDSNPEPSSKRMRQVTFEPVRLCSISSTKDIDNQVLRAQHYKLCERYRFKEKQIASLEQKVRDMDEKQNQEFSIMCTIDRSWNRFDEDVRLLLQRFDADATVDEEEKVEDDEFSIDDHFLKILSQLNNEEIDEKMKQRVEFSNRALVKLIQVFDLLVVKNDRVTSLLSAQNNDISTSENGAKQDENNKASNFSVDLVDEKLRNDLKEVYSENSRLQRLITKLQKENHRLSNKSAALEDIVAKSELKVEELSRVVEDTKFELENALIEVNKLDFRLADMANEQKAKAETYNKVETIKCNGVDDEHASISKTKLDELEKEFDSYKEIATSRLIEIEELTNRNKNLAAQLEKKTIELKYLPPEMVKQTAEYKSLQTHFTSIYDECRHLRQQNEDFRNQIRQLNESHAKQLEYNESEENQARLRNAEEMLTLQETFNIMKNEYENMRLEFETHLAAKDQSELLDKEFRALHNSYALQNKQYKEEAARFKRKWKDAVNMLARSQKELEAEKKIRETCIVIELHEEPQEIKSPDAHGNNHVLENSESVHKNSDDEEEELNSEEMSLPVETRQEKLVMKLRKRIADLKMKLEIVKSQSLDERERFDLLVKERRLVQERDTLKETVRKLSSNDKRERARYYSDEAKKRIRSLDDLCEKLRKDLANAKNEEEGLMNEMESTGQAYDDIIEQNTRLAQQLTEKEDANLKLMSDLIRLNAAAKKSKEDREHSIEEIANLQNTIEGQQLLLQKLQDKERSWSHTKGELERALITKDQSVESHKRKAVESAQNAIDLRLQLEKTQTQLNEIQEAMASKTAQLEGVSTKIKRLEEEKKKWKQKYEHAKKAEQFENVDQLLEAENKMLKADLTCGSCKVNRKNAIFTKCWHMFCFDCIKQLYDGRRRRCPKCNGRILVCLILISANFGANDFRRVYLNT